MKSEQPGGTSEKDVPPGCFINDCDWWCLPLHKQLAGDKIIHHHDAGGGTVAMYIANLDVDTVDMGVPVLSVHGPMRSCPRLMCIWRTAHS